VGVSVFTLTVLSFDRYTAIERRVPFLRGPNPKLVIIVCVSVIWVTSIGLALPAALFSHLMTIPLGNVTEESSINVNETAIPQGKIVVCYPFPEEFGPIYAKVVVLLRFLVHYFQPLLIISTFYAIMTHHLLRRYHFQTVQHKYYNQRENYYFVYLACRLFPARQYCRQVLVTVIIHQILYQTTYVFLLI
jgi:hypothetical protein